MLFYELKVNEQAYNLKLTTKSIILLEKDLKCNPLAIFGDGERIPTVSEMVEILHASLQQYQHEITKADTMKIFDSWLNDGHTITDFIEVIIEIYKVSGIIKEDTQTEKNA